MEILLLVYVHLFVSIARASIRRSAGHRILGFAFNFFGNC